MTTFPYWPCPRRVIRSTHFIDDSASANIMEIRTKARRLQMEQGLGMLIIDYLQLMESRNKSSGDNRTQEVADYPRPQIHRP